MKAWGRVGVLSAIAALVAFASCRDVAVTAVDVDTITVQPDATDLAVGESARLTARVEDEAGRELRRTVTWSTSSQAIATVASDGTVLAQGPGTARITASVDGKSGDGVVNVTAIPVAAVTVVPDIASLTVGDSIRLEAEARAQNGAELTGRIPTWTSSDPGIATVLPDGWVHAIGVGTATITATIEGVHGEATVTVRGALQAVANVRIEPASASVPSGDTVRLQAIATASNGNVVTGRTPLWTSNATATATVNSTGLVRAIAPGTAGIIATVDGVAGQATITVGAAVLRSIEVNPSSSTLAIGGSATLQATARATDGSVLPGVTITWSSSAPATASIDQNGVVRGLTVGTATITASGGGKSGTATVFVVSQPVNSVVISPSAPNVFVADTLNLSVALLDATGATLTGRQVTWTSSDTMIAVIESTGPTTQQARLIGRRSGNVTISAAVESRSDQVTATVTPRADLLATKTSSVALVKAGDTIVFTLQVRNQGPSPAASVVVTDTLPANATFVDATGGATLSGLVLTWPAVASMAVNAQSAFTIRVLAPASGSVTNVGAAVSSTPERNPLDNRAASTVNVNPADLVVTKTAASGPISAGQTIVYTVDVRNAGTSAAGNVSVTDTLPLNVTFVDATGSPARAGNVLTWPVIGSLAAGANVTFTVRVIAPSAGSVTNVAAATAPAGDANPSDNRSAVTVTVNALADLVVTKTASAATVNAGETITYAIRVRNDGPSAAADVIVRDTLPSNAAFVGGSAPGATLSGSVLSWPAVASLAAGDSIVVGLQVTSPAGGTVNNVAAATTSTVESSTTNNRSSTSTTVAAANLSVTKSGPATAAPGDPIAYTVQVTNSGPGRAVGVVITDTLPAGVNFTDASAGGTHAGGIITWPTLQLNSGASVSYNVNVVAQATGSLVNVAAATAGTVDPDPANNRATVTTTVASADLGVSKSGPASVNAGSAIDWSITVTNGGPTAAGGVVVQDTLPAGVTFVSASTGGTHSGGVVTWNLGGVASGTAVPLSVQATSPSDAASLTNVARVTSATKDPDATNNRGTSTTTVVPVANLGITKGATAQVNPGGTITYTINVSNTGPSGAAGVVVTDTLPAGVTFVSASNSGSESGGVVTWPAVAVAVSGGLSYSVTVTAPATAGTLVNVARVAATTTDPDGSNNRATASTTVTQANVSVSKTGPVTATVADTLTYTITVSNAGPSAASGVIVHDTLPLNATLHSALPPPSSQAGGVLTWNAGAIASGGNAQFVVQLLPPALGGVVTNAADAASLTNDPDPGNNHSSITTTVVPAANLSVQMTALPTTVSAGDIVEYTITVANLGPSAAADVVVSDALPSNGTFVDATGGATPVANVVTFPTIPSLAPAASAVYSVRLSAPAQGTLTNTASASSSTLDPVPGNNSAVVSLPVAGADMDVFVTGPAAAAPGETIEFVITVTNGGPGQAQGVAITNTLPSNATFVGADPTGYILAGGVLTWNETVIASGDNRVYRVSVTAPLIGNVVNAVNVSSSSNDPNLTNNNSSATTVVNPLAADIEVKLSASHANAVVGDTIDYTFEVTNNGPGTAIAVSMQNTLAGNVSYVPGSASGGGTETSGVLNWPVTLLLAPGGVTTLTFRAVATAPGTATNVAAAGSLSPDPNGANNTATVQTVVN